MNYLQAGDDLDLKHRADGIMIEALKLVKPGTFGERVARWIAEKIISLKLKLGMGLIDDEAKQIADELHKPIRHKFQRRMVVVHHYNEIHCCDLIHLIPPKQQGKTKYNYVLTYMDIFSRFAWAFPLKNKTSEQLIECLARIWKTDKPLKVWPDKESGLYSKAGEKFFKQNNVELYSTESEIKCGPIERFNRTLKDKVERIRTEI